MGDKNTNLTISLSPEQRALWDHAAQLAGITVTSYIKTTVTRESRRVIAEHNPDFRDPDLPK